MAMACMLHGFHEVPALPSKSTYVKLIFGLLEVLQVLSTIQKPSTGQLYIRSGGRTPSRRETLLLRAAR